MKTEKYLYQYAHHYLDWGWVRVFEEDGTHYDTQFTGVMCDYLLLASEEDEDWEPITNCKLILRPLPDITDEELTKMGYSDRHDSVHQLMVKLNAFEPEIFMFLLSCGFDLFGLIEAGIALNKTKI